MSIRDSSSWTKVGGIMGRADAARLARKTNRVGCLAPFSLAWRGGRPRGSAPAALRLQREVLQLSAAGQCRLEPAWLQAAPAPGFSRRGVAVFRRNLVAARLALARLGSRPAAQVGHGQTIFGHQGPHFFDRLAAL